MDNKQKSISKRKALREKTTEIIKMALPRLNQTDANELKQLLVRLEARKQDLQKFDNDELDNSEDDFKKTVDFDDELVDFIVKIKSIIEKDGKKNDSISAGRDVIQVTRSTGAFQQIGGSDNKMFGPSTLDTKEMKTTPKTRMKTIKVNEDWKENVEIQQAKTGYKRSSYKDTEIYPMVKIPRGKCLIINNVKFAEERLGSDIDVRALDNIFSKLHFRVEVKPDLTKKGMKDELTKCSKDEDHGDALVVVILSHGGSDGPFGIDKQQLPVKEIYELFRGTKCPSLLGKPKMFFFQMCRTEDSASQYKADGSDVANVSDIILAFSTVQGYVSYRNENTGSYYIQKLRDCLAELAATHHLKDILEEVDRRVQQHFASQADPETQVSSYTSNGFNKKLFFNP